MFRIGKNKHLKLKKNTTFESDFIMVIKIKYYANLNPIMF
jgi:hypothetical protein